MTCCQPSDSRRRTATPRAETWSATSVARASVRNDATMMSKRVSAGGVSFCSRRGRRNWRSAAGCGWLCRRVRQAGAPGAPLHGAQPRRAEAPPPPDFASASTRTRRPHPEQPPAARGARSFVGRGVAAGSRREHLGGHSSTGSNFRNLWCGAGAATARAWRRDRLATGSGAATFGGAATGDRCRRPAARAPPHVCSRCPARARPRERARRRSCAPVRRRPARANDRTAD